jgi:molybdenum cofactor cytidylyltransferase
MAMAQSIDDSGPPRLVAVILAAGEGSRWRFAGGQGHKLLAPFRGQTVVWWAAHNAQEAGLELIVVSGAIDLLHLPSGCRVVYNPAWAEGQSTSLSVGIAVAAEHGASGVIVGLGDQPGVLVTSWASVAAAPIDRPIAVASYEGQRGQPIRLMAEIWPLLPKFGDEGARSLIRVRSDLVMEVPCEGLATQLTDIDLPEDVAPWN